MACKFELEHIGVNTPNADEAAKRVFFTYLV